MITADLTTRDLSVHMPRLAVREEGFPCQLRTCPCRDRGGVRLIKVTVADIMICEGCSAWTARILLAVAVGVVEVS